MSNPPLPFLFIVRFPSICARLGAGRSMPACRESGDDRPVPGSPYFSASAEAIAAPLVQRKQASIQLQGWSA
jgi:hypothetical protein